MDVGESGSVRQISPEIVAAGRNFGHDNRISGEIDPDDYIFWYILENSPGKTEAEVVIEYLSSGSASVLLLRQLLEEYRVRIILDGKGLRPEQVSILEFAAGYGRVTRHFPSVFPGPKVMACDIHHEAVDFIRHIGFDACQSAHQPSAFRLERTFDVIFAFSFFTHMPRSTWTAWLQALSDHLSDDGIMIFTTHGEVSQALMLAPPLEDDGFFFHTSSEQKDLEAAEYGNTITAFDFVNTQLKRTGLRLVQFKQSGAGHHDVFVVHKAANLAIYTDAGIHAERQRLVAEEQRLNAERDDAIRAHQAATAQHALELRAVQTSTSWRLTAGLRAISRLVKRP